MTNCDLSPFDFHEHELESVPDRCPECGGEIVAIGLRAWRIRPYAEDGCGAYFRLRKGV